ncbi:MAG: hypothetical protein A2289_05005 [Deltaproteobacteria bacterium RIFOXYA12_FULL_58_15]|nr:MAG: hypothetical protein A2289_05005 [Deltaproteobacteria bacterium RIFOXYA12_FULL_58_15]OGR09380.1 MAG: hypothetical protein A2341_17985 [Deltaproteobacteria bacterium RIFOXYB12_FULL_58_9]
MRLAKHMHWKDVALPLVALLGTAAGCATKVTQIDCEAEPERCVGANGHTAPRIYVDPPFGVAFACVTLGCEETRTLTVENRGLGTLAIPLVRLALGTSNDFTMRLIDEDGQEMERPPSPDDPLEVNYGRSFDIEVTYVPSDAAPDEGHVQINWYNGDNSFASADIQQVMMPLRARVLGKARSSLRPMQVRFGFVEVGQSGSASVEIENVSPTDAILEVRDVVIPPGSPEQFLVSPGWEPLANPGDSIRVPIEFWPDELGTYLGELLVITNDEDKPLWRVELLGTSISGTWLEVLDPPSGILAFAGVRAEDTRTGQIKVRNAGGVAAEIEARLVNGDEAGFALATTSRGSLGVLDTLDETTVTVVVVPPAGGPLYGELGFFEVNSGDQLLNVPLEAIGLAPALSISETRIDFGSLVLGWTSDSSAVTISNTGTGDLVIDDIKFEIGASTSIHTADMPTLPISLAAGGSPLSLHFYATANTLGDQNAGLLVYNNSVNQPVQRVNLTAQVVSCEEECPISNGIPDCSSGRCDLAACNVDEGYHDTNGLLADGCECLEERQGDDVGASCTDGEDLGTLGDRCSIQPNEKNRYGNLHSGTDIDLYYFSNEDENNLNPFDGCDYFSDTAAASVELVSGPPGLVLCVKMPDHGNGCGGYPIGYWDPDSCGSTLYKNEGAWVEGKDEWDVTAWVMWQPGYFPVCSEYHLEFRGRK